MVSGLPATLWWTAVLEGFQWVRRDGLGATVSEIHPSSLGRFVRAIAVLALDAEGQIAWLQSMGGLPEDELALEFEDGRLLAFQFEEMRWVKPGLGPTLAPLNELLSNMSGSGQDFLWSPRGLCEAQEWTDARRLARAVLPHI